MENQERGKEKREEKEEKGEKKNCGKVRKKEGSGSRQGKAVKQRTENEEGKCLYRGNQGEKKDEGWGSK